MDKRRKFLVLRQREIQVATVEKKKKIVTSIVLLFQIRNLTLIDARLFKNEL